MMVALLLYAYAVGERSSPQIERRCREDVAFRVIAANRFLITRRSRGSGCGTSRRWRRPFTQVLALVRARRVWCRSGWSRSTEARLAGNASPGATRSYAAIREEVERDPRGGRPGRRGRGRAATARRAATSCPRSSPTAARGSSGYVAAGRSSRQEQADERGRLPGEPGLARRAGRRSTGASWPGASRPRRTRRARRAQDQHDRSRHTADEAGRRQNGAGLQRPSRRQPRPVIIAAEVTSRQRRRPARTDGRRTPPSRLAARGIEKPIGCVLADGGYWNSAPRSPRSRHRHDVLVPTQDRTAPAARYRPQQGDGPSGSNRSWRPTRRDSALPTPPADRRARLRQHNIRRIDRFQRRGLEACQAEWKLIAATHNLLKLWRAGLANAQATIAEPLAA